MPKRTALWIDQQEARVVHVRTNRIEELVLVAPHHVHHATSSDPERVSQHRDDTKRFFHEVLRSLKGAKKLVILGPPSPKDAFLRYVNKHEPSLGARVEEVDSGATPANGHFIAHVKRYFQSAESPR